MYLLCALICLLPFLASGQILVTNIENDGAGSLRNAIEHLPSQDVIIFDQKLDGKTLILNSPISIDKLIEIDASKLDHGITIRGRRDGRLFAILEDGSLTLNRIRLTDGKADRGGAFLVAGSLTLNECHLFENSAEEGAGIYVESGGSTTINSSTLAYHDSGDYFESSNVLRSTTVIRVRKGSDLFVENSTLAENKGVAIRSDGNVSISLSTISRNQAGFVQSTPRARASIKNSIISGNGSGGAANVSGDPEKFLAPGLLLLGNNILDGDALLGPLADHGGFTPVMPPLPGSPADNFPTGDIDSPDQLGYLPRSGQRRTIGAVESGSYPRLGETIANPIVRVTRDQLSPHPDEHALSLREAITFARPGSTITFGDELVGVTFLLTLGQISSEREIQLIGPSKKQRQKIQGLGGRRVFNFGRESKVSLKYLELSHGSDADGGAIFNNGNLSMDHCKFSNNHALGKGGALFIQSNGQASITNCIFDHNSSGFEGAAIYADGKTMIDSSSVTRNRILYPINFQHPVVLKGAAVYAWSSLLQELRMENVTVAENDCHGVINWSGRTTLKHCTITSNQGKGFHRFEAKSTMIFSCIIAGNSEDGDFSPSEIDGDHLSFLKGPPDLLPLDFYGGPTETMPPKPDSPVIDAGGDSEQEIDQRGLPRIVGVAVDLGAAEYQGKALEWIAGFNADSDRDGAANGLESALGRDPFFFNPEPILTVDGLQSDLFLVFPKPSATYSNFVSVQLLQSAHLTEKFEEILSNRSRPFEPTGGEIIIPLQPNNARFFRLEATLK